VTPRGGVRRPGFAAAYAAAAADSAEAADELEGGSAGPAPAGDGRGEADWIDLNGALPGRIAASDAMYVTDERQRITAWSAGARRLLGYHASEVVGRYCYEVMTGRRPDGHPVCGSACPVTRNARRGRGTAAYEVTAVARDGTPRYVNNSILVLEGTRGAFRVVHVVRESCDTPPLRPPEPDAVEAGDDATTSAEQLTRREMQVLRLFARGRTLEQVAEELAISVFTARNHATSIQHKLGVRNRLQMVLEGMRRGLV
jgi:PAS domain S-box-containing protein